MRFAVLLLSATLALQAQMTRRAPGFSLPDTKGKQHDLADYRGKIVLLDIMQTNCPKCLELTKVLNQIKEKYTDKVQVLSVVTLPDNMNTVSKFIAASQVSNPVLFDCGQMIGSYLNLSPANPTVHFPHLIVIDKNGMIRRDLTDDATLTNITSIIDTASK